MNIYRAIFLALLLISTPALSHTGSKPPTTMSPEHRGQVRGVTAAMYHAALVKPGYMGLCLISDGDIFHREVNDAVLHWLAHYKGRRPADLTWLAIQMTYAVWGCSTGGTK